MFAGATAGLVSRCEPNPAFSSKVLLLTRYIHRFVVAPLDVLKIRLQLHYHSLAEPLSHPTRGTQSAAGVFTTARDILRHEGFTAFWKGNIPAEGLYLSYGAVQFLTYRSTAEALGRITTGVDGQPQISGAMKSFIAGAVAGTAATGVTYPLDLLRTRFAAQGTERVYTGLIASVRDITRLEGYRGFFRGLSAGVVQVIPYMGLFFALYESFKVPFAATPLPFGSSDALAGTAASVLAKTVVFPLDTVRKRLQVQGPTRSRYIGGANFPVYENGLVHTISTIARREGLRGLYRGLWVSLAKAAPTSAVTMWTYERVLKIARAYESHDEVA